MTEKQYSLVYHADKGGAFIKNNETGQMEYYKFVAAFVFNRGNNYGYYDNYSRERI